MYVSLGRLLFRTNREQAIWSQKTFGTDEERGPTGALEHLKLEANECIEAPDDIVEYADCLLLLLDANRRAGFGLMELVQAAYDKLQVNKERDWIVPDGDSPTLHKK